MMRHVIDISNGGAKLSMSHDCLVLGMKDEQEKRVLMREVAVLILAHPQVTCTRAVMTALMEERGVLLTCDEKNHPVGMMLPLTGHHVQTERVRAQVSAAQPTNKRLWQAIVKAKVRAQGRVLSSLHESDSGLFELSREVRSGDVSNVEAQASRRYWGELFDDVSFRRQRFGEDQNRFLNYGYAVLRAMTARAICAAGLMPYVGVHHHNRYNAFCLADDLMEPYRALVDRAVVEVVGEWGADVALDEKTKPLLLNPLIRDLYEHEGEQRSLFDLLGMMAVSLVEVYSGERRDLVIAEVV